MKLQATFEVGILPDVAELLQEFDRIKFFGLNRAANEKVRTQITGDPGDFGRIVSTSNNPRLIQFALKFSF